MIAAIRSWLAGFGHPATTKPLPDPVRWTVPLAGEDPQRIVDHLNRVRREDHTERGGDKWHLIEVTEDGPAGWAILQRTDGAYRHRDDGFKGF